MMTNEELVKVTAADSKAASLTELTLPPLFLFTAADRRAGH